MRAYGITLRDSYRDLSVPARTAFEVRCAPVLVTFLGVSEEEALRRLRSSPPSWLLKVDETTAGLSRVATAIIDAAEAELGGAPSTYLWFGTIRGRATAQEAP